MYLSSANIIWSKTVMSMIFPASINLFVIDMSSVEGSGFPLGWLCANIIWAHVATIAPLNTSLECTTDEFNVPSEMTSNPVTILALLSQNTTNFSFTSSSNKNENYPQYQKEQLPLFFCPLIEDMSLLSLWISMLWF